jgi:hypothetical protein
MSAIVPGAAGDKFRLLARGSSGSFVANVWMAIEAW